MNTRMNRNALQIGTYILQDYARTEEHIKDLKACGIDFVVCMANDRPALDLFAKYGVGAIVSGVVPGWWGGDGVHAGKMHEVNTYDKYEAGAKAFADHPAVWGIDAGDEPSALDFPHYGKVLRWMEELFPNQFAYLNLYPNYASVAKNTAEQTVCQLGTATYDEHIAEYCKYVGTDYICYDFYLYSINVQGALDNLRTVADACRNTGRSLWIVLQVNSVHPEHWISENELRFQAYTAMAYGTEVVTWACYTAGWWENQVLDKDGNKTEQYEKLKTVNAELHNLSAAYMKYRRTETYLVSSVPCEGFDKSKETVIPSLDSGFAFDMKASDGSPIAIGEMVARDGSHAHAYFVATCDDPHDQAHKAYELTFKLNGNNRAVKAQNGRGALTVIRDADGTIRIPLESNDGVLVEII